MTPRERLNAALCGNKGWQPELVAASQAIRPGHATVCLAKSKPCATSALNTPQIGLFCGQWKSVPRSSTAWRILCSVSKTKSLGQLHFWGGVNKTTPAPRGTTIGVATGGQRGHAPPKFLKNIVILCFERRFSKQNSVIRLKSNILAPPKFLGWLRHWERRMLFEVTSSEENRNVCIQGLSRFALLALTRRLHWRKCLVN